MLPRAARERRHTTASQNLLKAPQRKVTATLAKLVLSARAIQYDSSADAPNTPNRIKYDAEELDRHIVAFVQEVQRCVQLQIHGVTGLKRLRGYFSTSNIGLGLVGAGFGGSWKGLGWVAIEENEEPPGRILGNEVVAELDTVVDQIHNEFVSFHAALKHPTGKVSIFFQVRVISYVISDDRLAMTSRDLIGRLSALLVFVADIHVARHVDIDGIGRELANASDDDLYLQTVTNARFLVRTLEATMQSLYDDGSAFLLATQNMHSGQPTEKDHAHRDYLDAIANCIQANLNAVHQTVEALLTVGHDQADMSHGDYSGSIEWRMSRLSLTPTQSERQRPKSGVSVVDMATAFRTPNRRPKASLDESTLNDPDTASMSTARGPRSETPPGTLSDRDIDSLLDDSQS
jgi:son of sevenless-like protein